MPAMVHEQNAVLGRANRLVAGRRVRASRPRSPDPLRRRAIARRLVGNPVRESVRALRSSPIARPGRERVIDLLVFGGSQGAASFSQVIPAALLSLPAADARAAAHRAAVPAGGSRAGPQRPTLQAGIVAELAPFFADLPQRLASAHLVIGRSGASTVAELATIGRPSILVPYPYAADDHQTANARAFEAAGACIVIPHAEFTAPTPGRPPARAARSARSAWPRWPRPPTPPAGPMPRRGWPISSAS